MATDQGARIPGTSMNVAELTSILPGDVRGLLLYGSRARGTSGSRSDVDVLQLSSSSGPTFHKDLLSVSRYDIASLRALMIRGSIFGRHLRNEGQILWDPEGQLRSVLNEFVDPPSYAQTLRVINLIARALGLPHNPKYDRGVHRAAVYCARTALYISSIKGGSEHFDTTRIATDFGFEQFDRARKELGPWALDYLLSMVKKLSDFEANGEVALAPDFESAVTQLAVTYPDASQFLASLLNVDSDLPYSTLSLPFA